MFEAGKYYDLTSGTDESWESVRAEVLDWQHPLLKYKEVGSDREVILNTASNAFWKAEVAPSPADIEQAERAFFEKIRD